MKAPGSAADRVGEIVAISGWRLMRKLHSEEKEKGRRMPREKIKR
jgi:hypothetical protein